MGEAVARAAAGAGSPYSISGVGGAGGIKKEVAQQVVKKWEEAGVADDPGALQKLFLKQSAVPIFGTVLQTLIDAAATYSIWTSALYFS
ncbi:hypothetical protein MNEG_0269 [Monoraphidium neglectum]|uniref:Uncharacterized protein n=1 Tax=Monoraphidium neglectum TaxID=145388 RepID=A0A0D2N603_9CHLO|nr:hypothetical protein MNEG_0269 [Monoraphidium neglectum]KIZ07677.1 hypothetical protein MNEG_0269 [Monoraphidium neglectum]|eukprot:XP_013906696.1 hypothetical protein MNEG_0269 [Monoraphidium neglectum]